MDLLETFKLPSRIENPLIFNAVISGKHDFFAVLVSRRKIEFRPVEISKFCSSFIKNIFLQKKSSLADWIQFFRFQFLTF